MKVCYYVSASLHEFVSTLKVPWLFGVTACDRILCTRGGAPDTLEVPTQHRVIEGPDIGYDRRLHLGVTIDTNHLPTLSAEHLSNTGSTAKYL